MADVDPGAAPLDAQRHRSVGIGIHRLVEQFVQRSWGVHHDLPWNGHRGAAPRRAGCQFSKCTINRCPEPGTTSVP